MWLSGKIKNLPDNAGGERDVDLMPRWGTSPGVRNGNLLQYSCLENSMDGGDWQATDHGVPKGWTGLSMLARHER